MKKVDEIAAVTDPRAFVRYWFNSNTKTARAALREPSLLDSIRLDYEPLFYKVKSLNMDRKLNKIGPKLIEYAFNEYVQAQLKEEMNKALRPLACVQENLEHIKNWVVAVTGNSNPNDVAVMAHWVWLIKRNGFALPVKHQIMPVLYGPQGGGKTVALEKLISPVSGYRLTIGMNQLSDERVFEGMANNYVVLFDELQGVERADMNALKKQITTTHNSYRKLYSHSVLQAPMKCSFIGATNRPINESFNDSTGMRRFWQINALLKLNWDLIGEIDYTALYKGIDENKEEGYMTGEQLQDVHKSQQNYVNKDHVEEFVSDNALRPDSENVTLICQEELYTAYSLWSGRVGIQRRLDLSWFSRKLIGRLAHRFVKNSKGHERRVYEINSNADIVPGTGTDRLLKGVTQ